MKQIFTLAVFITMLSCNNSSPDITMADSTTKKEDSVTTSERDRKGEQGVDNDSTIYIHFMKDSISATADGFLKGRDKRVNVYIDVKQGKQLNALLQPADKNSNLRINQVIMPNGKADGPFGAELVYRIAEQGLYKLIIGENLMAEGPAQQKFRLRVTVQ